MPVSPTSAFVRAVAVPGWGHASIGALTRAGFYVALEGTTAYGIFRTRSRIAEARARADLQERVVRRQLAIDGVTDLEEIATALEDDPDLADLEGLVEARRQQQEDWVAIGIFLLMLSGADAFVSAHLQDFPTPISVQAAGAADGRMEVRFEVPIGR